MCVCSRFKCSSIVHVAINIYKFLAVQHMLHTGNAAKTSPVAVEINSTLHKTYWTLRLMSWNICQGFTSWPSDCLKGFCSVLCSIIRDNNLYSPRAKPPKTTRWVPDSHMESKCPSYLSVNCWANSSAIKHPGPWFWEIALTCRQDKVSASKPGHPVC